MKKKKKTSTRKKNLGLGAGGMGAPGLPLPEYVMLPKTLLLGSQGPCRPFSRRDSGARGSARIPAHLVEQHVGVRQQVVWLRAEATCPVQGLQLEDRPLVRSAARRAPRRPAAYIIPQVVLAHNLHHATRPRLFQESLGLEHLASLLGIPSRYSALPAESVKLGALLHNHTLTRNPLLPPPGC